MSDSKESTKVLYFTDAHVSPEERDISRFWALGNFIVDTRPDVIVQGGDFSSVESLSHWDKDKRRLMEHRRYQDDVNVTREAIEQLFAPLHILQNKQKRNKERFYKPQLFWIEGNHEYWVEGYLNYNPILEGAVHWETDIELPYDLFSTTKYVPYRSPTSNMVSIDGVLFTHAPRNRAGVISSKYLSDRSLAEVFECSVVFGHTHRFTIGSLARLNREGDLAVHHAINGGCFFEKNPLYSHNNTNDYWKGVLLLDCSDGKVRIERQLDIATLKKEYGNG